MHYVEAKSILSQKNGMNIYRGCSHGCIYCDSRSKCYAFDHPFEDIEVKINAPQLLETALQSKRKKCMIGTGSMCDPYLHIEKELCLTRKCLELIDHYEFGATVLTKSSMVLRDLDLYKSINNHSKAVIQMTLTTADDVLCGIIEPNVSSTLERFETLMRFKKEGIPTVVWLCPILPYINDSVENINSIIDYCIEAGVKGIVNFGMGLTLRDGNREYFYNKLDEYYPGLKNKYIEKYGNSYSIPSPNEKLLSRIFEDRCQKNNIMFSFNEIFSYLNEYSTNYMQYSLWEN